MIPHSIADQFLEHNQAVVITPFGNGLINDTWLVKSAEQPFILQRINRTVFPQPEHIMTNLEAVNRHLKKFPQGMVKLKFPEIIKAHGLAYYIDGAGSFWRALSFIENTQSIEIPRSLSDAEQVGLMLGHYHHLLSSLEPALLHDTLPGFHITPDYLERYTQVLNNDNPTQSNNESDYCQNFIQRHLYLANSLEYAKCQGVLKLRVIHGDPKLNNILFDCDSHKAVSIIDLDTTKPGLVHYDIGDCLRSSCNTGNEESASAYFDMEICSAILKNYLQEAQEFFTEPDYDFIFTAIQLIPFELGLRFYTDYLEGNRYFKVTEPEQNLHRAINQFQLMDSITRQQSAIEKLVTHLKAGHHRTTLKQC